MTPTDAQLEAAFKAFKDEANQWKTGVAPAGFWAARTVVEVGRAKAPRRFFPSQEEAEKVVVVACIKAAFESIA